MHCFIRCQVHWEQIEESEIYVPSLQKKHLLWIQLQYWQLLLLFDCHQHMKICSKHGGMKSYLISAPAMKQSLFADTRTALVMFGSLLTWFNMFSNWSCRAMDNVFTFDPGVSTRITPTPSTTFNDSCACAGAGGAEKNKWICKDCNSTRWTAHSQFHNNLFCKLLRILGSWYMWVSENYYYFLHVQEYMYNIAEPLENVAKIWTNYDITIHKSLEKFIADKN